MSNFLTPQKIQGVYDQNLTGDDAPAARPPIQQTLNLFCTHPANTQLIRTQILTCYNLSTTAECSKLYTLHLHYTSTHFASHVFHGPGSPTVTQSSISWISQDLTQHL